MQYNEDSCLDGNQAAMVEGPPFPPPYKTFEEAPNGLRVIETLADGSTRIVPADETAQLARRWQANAPRSAASKPPIRPLARSNDRAAMYLSVPFAEKDEAKRLGAKWDSAMRKWYMPHGADANRFARWWPDMLKQEMKAFGES